MLVPLYLTASIVVWTCVSAGEDNQPPGANSLENSEPKHREIAEVLMEEAGHIAEEQKSKEYAINNLEVPDDFSILDDPDMMRISAGLIRERKRLQRRMFYHVATSTVLGALIYFLRSNPVLLHTFMLLNDQNESWGANVEALWINHQEKMANFLLKMMEKNNYDAKTAQGKNIRLEIGPGKFQVVPVYRTFPDEALPDDAKQINNNKVNLWKNFFYKR